MATKFQREYAIKVLREEFHRPNPTEEQIEHVIELHRELANAMLGPVKHAPAPPPTLAQVTAADLIALCDRVLGMGRRSASPPEPTPAPAPRSLINIRRANDAVLSLNTGAPNQEHFRDTNADDIQKVGTKPPAIGIVDSVDEFFVDGDIRGVVAGARRGVLPARTPVQKDVSNEPNRVPDQLVRNEDDAVGPCDNGKKLADDFLKATAALGSRWNGKANAKNFGK